MKNLKLDAFEMLQENQLRNVIGGYIQEEGECRFTFISSDGNTTETQTISTGYAADPSDSTWANSHCVQAIGMGWGQCFYDCNHDGYGQ